MQKIYFLVGGGILLAIAAGITIATMQPKSTQTSSSGSPSPATNASSPAAVTTSPSATSSPDSSSLGKPSPGSTPSPTTTSGGSPIAKPSPGGTSNPSPVAIAPQTTGSSNPIQLESCKISMIRVLDPNPPLNLRSTPEVKPDNIVGKLDNGTFLQVKAEQDGWFQVTSLDGQSTNGWVSKKQTEHGCNRKVARLSLRAGASPTIVSDRFIGDGSHQYRINASKGQTLVLVVKSQMAPYVLDPSEKLIAGTEQGDGINGTWTGKLPADGTYTISLDSSFRGYPYSFSVQLK